MKSQSGKLYARFDFHDRHRYCLNWCCGESGFWSEARQLLAKFLRKSCSNIGHFAIRQMKCAILSFTGWVLTAPSRLCSVHFLILPSKLLEILVSLSVASKSFLLWKSNFTHCLVTFSRQLLIRRLCLWQRIHSCRVFDLDDTSYRQE